MLDALAEVFAPTRCAGCDLPGELLCRSCRERLAFIDADRSCPSCGAPYGRLVCTECWDRTFAFDEARAVGVLDGELARAIVLHKDAGERRLGAVIGSLIGDVTARCWPGWAEALTWVPATTAALRRRGFDHGRSIAEQVARTTGVPCCALLERARARDQRGLGRDERLSAARARFRVLSRPPDRVLLIDDVFTTGATLQSASEALVEAGAVSVRVAVAGRAW